LGHLQTPRGKNHNESAKSAKEVRAKTIKTQRGPTPAKTKWVEQPPKTQPQLLKKGKRRGTNKTERKTRKKEPGPAKGWRYRLPE